MEDVEDDVMERCLPDVVSSPGEMELDSIRAELLQIADALDDVHAATERLSQGAYGRCARCGEQIWRDTLSANPTAELCASCGRAPIRRGVSDNFAGSGVAVAHDGV
ncbi:MAG: TraR/DksA C4-type zinc finger protein [Actinobacteria bacterium]|nr:TraR/DksA C4-type zinc finger protein [Actinomycetota bacterium]